MKPNATERLKDGTTEAQHDTASDTPSFGKSVAPALGSVVPSFCRSVLPFLALNALFAGSIAFAYVWFNTDIGRSRPSSLDAGPSIWLSVNTNIPGYTFIPEPVSEEVTRILSTADIVNGSFVRNRRTTEQPNDGTTELSVGPSLRPSVAPLPDRVTLFLASWTANDKCGLTAIQHTPDVCWVGSGWKPVDAGQPAQLQLTLKDRTTEKNRRTERQKNGSSELLSIRPSVAPTLSASALKDRTTDGPNDGSSLDPRPSTLDPIPLPFTCRVFRSPDAQSSELAAWCTFVGGRPIAEPILNLGEASDSLKTSIQRVYQKRKAILWQFWQVLESRSSTSATRQFARISTGLAGNATSAAAALSGFSRLALASE